MKVSVDHIIVIFDIFLQFPFLAVRLRARERRPRVSCAVRLPFFPRAFLGTARTPGSHCAWRTLFGKVLYVIFPPFDGFVPLPPQGEVEAYFCFTTHP